MPRAGLHGQVTKGDMMAAIERAAATPTPVELWELHKIHLDVHGWSVLAIGLAVASLSAFIAIWGLMRMLERFSAWPFVVYRGLLGAVLLTGIAMGWLS